MLERLLNNAFERVLSLPTRLSVSGLFCVFLAEHSSQFRLYALKR